MQSNTETVSNVYQTSLQILSLYLPVTTCKTTGLKEDPSYTREQPGLSDTSHLAQERADGNSWQPVQRSSCGPWPSISQPVTHMNGNSCCIITV